MQARAEKIGLAKLKSPIEGWPGTITAAGVSEGIDHQEGSMVIIDGQHRLGACSFLESKVGNKVQGRIRLRKGHTSAECAANSVSHLI